MKKIFAFMAIAAILASCTKEIDRNEIAGDDNMLVPVTLSASLETDTKAALDSDGKSVVWEGTESIAVFDDVNTDIHKFDAAGSGATASFSGTANSGAASFVAVYPYKASITYVPADDKPVNAEIPNVQEATPGSFDPAAALYVASAASSDAALNFKAAFALLKVDVDVPDVISISVENTKNNLSGSVKASISGGVSNGDGSKYKNVTLSKEDGTALAQGVYYIVVRHLGSSSEYENFAVSYATSTGISGSRAAGANVTSAKLGRKAILNLGKLSAVPASKSYYALYESGADIKIGNTTINKAANGAATLLVADGKSLDFVKANLEGGGVYFLRTEGSGTFNSPNNPTISKKLFLISDSDDLVPVSMANVFNAADGELYVKGLSFTMTGGKNSYFSVNKNTSASMSNLVIDNCAFVMPQYLVTTNSGFKTYGIKNIGIYDSSFSVSVAKTALINVTSTYAGIAEYDNFEFCNNYVFSSTGANIVTMIFNYTGNTGDKMVVTANNNLFYNTIGGGIIKHNTLKEVTATKNLFWAAEGSDPGANGKLFAMTLKEPFATVHVSDNVAYGTLAGSRKWAISDATVKGDMDDLTIAESDPVANADTASGTFTLVAAYTAYGPQAE